MSTKRVDRVAKACQDKAFSGLGFAMNNSYVKHVEQLESNLQPYAKKSFESFSNEFVDGGEIHKFYEDEWQDESKRSRIIKRTPIQIERDRILYSNGIRKQTEKYHILYSGSKRIMRNYTTHTLRLTQVARSICRGLGLNEDFAEGIALGTKVGALPFIHASKEEVSDWMISKIKEIDNKETKSDGCRQIEIPFDTECKPPHWLSALESEEIKGKILRTLPIAFGDQVESAYSSGQQSYWLLSTNPYIMKSNPLKYSPEMMYGVWRHSLGIDHGPNSFMHDILIERATKKHHTISWKHLTYETIVVQYADDITWVIENINDADRAKLLNNSRREVSKGLFEDLSQSLNSFFGHDMPSDIMRALQEKDSGLFYSYFISNFVATSTEELKHLDIPNRQYLYGQDVPLIGLSEQAKDLLEKLKAYLNENVFNEPRVLNRTKMLRKISEVFMDYFYDPKNSLLNDYIKRKALLERWPDEEKKQALDLISNEIHRIQLAVNLFSEMGDQEIYDLLGVESM